MNRILILSFLFLFLLVTNFPSTGEKPLGTEDQIFYDDASGFLDIEFEDPSKLIYSFKADLYEGKIGNLKGIDDGKDNEFHIELDIKPKSNEKVWLGYWIKGVKDHNSIAKSINERQSSGGQLVFFHDEWVFQKEALDPEWLRLGKNIIRFYLPQNAKYEVEIKDLELSFEKGPKLDEAVHRQFVLNGINSQKTNSIFYLRGFLTGPYKEAAKLFINEREIENDKGEFELIFDKENQESFKEDWSLIAQYPDGKSIHKSISFKEKGKGFVSHINGKKGNVKEKLFKWEDTQSLKLEGASILVPRNSLKEDQILSITALREIDIPVLGSELINVTAINRGYRFLPHGSSFQKEISIGIPFDSTLIPRGYSKKDIKTYYYNEIERSWIAVRRDSIDNDSNIIYSSSTHFTDFINGILKVPESPETQGYTPTFIKDLKAANPAAGIVQIEPPTANNIGTANLNFPIKIPAGRRGMQPELSIQYNSDAGNGWMGLGWNLSIPSISLETRWGSPRFDPQMETETYLLDGSMLAPVAHRDSVFENRSAEKQFHPRIEGDFKKIIRHGNSPKNYWWEVTNKSGTRYYYGGLPSSGVLDNAVLKDDKGNIAYWSIVEVRDLNDNFYKYNCEIKNDPGIPTQNANLGRQIYLNSITYTGSGSTEGKYKIVFKRDDQLNETRRVDVRISARTGYKRVSASLLRKIEVFFENELIRTYDLQYQEGAFYKTLLSKIIELDKNGEEFYRNEFEYFDEVRENGEYKPYKAKEPWATVTDNVKGDLVSPSFQFPDNASALSGSSAKSTEVSFALTVGVWGNTTAKNGTVGGNFSFSNTRGEGLLALIDINGDGLPDKVFVKNDSLFFRPNLGNKSFGGKQKVIGISQFSTSKTRGRGKGIEAHPPFAFVGKKKNTTETRTETFFSDFNGDGFIDIASKGLVYFGFINSDGDLEFSFFSNDTPSPVYSGEALGDSIAPNIEEIQEELISEYPLHDMVRMWEAPQDGYVQIRAPVELLEDTSAIAASDNLRDGVRVSIQLADTELWASRILPNDYLPKIPFGLDSLKIDKGERIYFRVQSIENGSYDLVKWDPEITFLTVSPDERDAQNHSPSIFKASEDFILAACQSVFMPFDGEIRLQSLFTKPVLSDDIEVEIVKRDNQVETILFNQVFEWDTVINQTIDNSWLVEKDVEIFFRVKSTSNVNWGAVSWNPQIFYTRAQNTIGAPINVVDNAGEYIYSFCPAVEFTMYNHIVDLGKPWIAPNDGVAFIGPNIDFLPLQFGQNSIEGEVTITLKGINKLYAKKTYEYINNTLIGDTLPFRYDLQEDSIYFIEYHFTDFEILDEISSIGLDFIYGGFAAFNELGIYTKLGPDKMILGPHYRGWGHFVYNGNRGRADSLIQENLLILDPRVRDFNRNQLNNIEESDDIQDPYDPSQADVVTLISDPKAKLWRGYDEFTYLTGDSLSSSRLGEDNIILDAFGFNDDRSKLSTVTKVSRSVIDSYSISASPPMVPFSASLGDSETTTELTLDLIDFNGDSHPDILSKKFIQYTMPTAGLSSNILDHNLGLHISKASTTDDDDFTVGGSFVTAHTNNTGFVDLGAVSLSPSLTVGNNDFSVSTEITSKGPNIGLSVAYASINLNTIFSKSEDYVESSWMDINGDGLVDKVFKDGFVSLNTGYEFLPRESWGFSEIRKGASRDSGAGLGVNIGAGSLTAGLSQSITENETNHALTDLNGDGLIDMVLSTNPFKVRLNRGSDFGPEINWPGATRMDKGSTTGESANAAFTICIIIPIPFAPLRICFNPGINAGTSVSRQNTELSDINGDGFPDFLSSNNDGQLSVRESSIGRTNLLKRVHRPLNSSIELNYKREGNTAQMPQNKWVLSSTSLFDGFLGDGVDSMKMVFEYLNGYHDRNEREFLGFEEVRSYEVNTQRNDEIKRSSIAVYNNAHFYEKGLQKSNRLEDGRGNIFTESVYKYEFRDIFTGDSLSTDFWRNDAGCAFPALTQEITNYYEGQATPGLQKRVDYDYDKIGNVVHFTDYGDGTVADQIQAIITYHDVPANYLKAIPSSVEVFDSNSRLRKRESSIDSKGNISQIRQFLETGDIAHFEMSYDNRGNLNRILRPENHRNQRFFYDITYDSEVGIYPIEVKDAYGYTSRSEYEFLFGQKIKEIDLNQQEIQYQVDDRGRIEKITGPFELAAGQDYTIQFEYFPAASVPYAITRHYDPEHDSDITTVSFVDGLQRPIQVKKTGAIFNNPDSPDQIKMVVSGRITFDELGRTIESFYPITEDLGRENQFNFTYNQITPSKTQYDVLDRNVKVILPDGSETNYSYGFAPDNEGNVHFKAKQTDALSNIREEYTDVRNRKRATNDHGPDGNIWTNFYYNAMSELIKVKDQGGNETLYEYDHFGRQLSRNHPDAGLTTFVYDLTGNMISKATANLREIFPNGGGITYTYEFDRLIKIDYPENYQNQVRYHYGEAGAPYNRAGRIWLKEDASGGEELYFDPLGNTSKSIRTILVNLDKQLTYVSEFEYDTWNRIQKMIYADGEEIEYYYNPAGKLSRMSAKKDRFDYEIVKRLGYDEFEQRVFLELGNGTITEYSYESDRRRLDRLQVNTPALGGRKIMDNHYNYDVMNNVLGIENRVDVPNSFQFGGPMQQSFSYDKLYRLSSASGSWQGKYDQRSYNLAMSYDNLHNIRAKSQIHIQNGRDTLAATSYNNSYTYDSDKPHAPSKIGLKSYQYDANGNTTGQKIDRLFDTRQYKWDEENRIQAIIDNGYLSRYTYDDTGERVIKSHGGSQGSFVNGEPIGFLDHFENYTAYVNPYLVAREHTYTKHYYIEGQRILSKIGSGVFKNQYSILQANTAGSIDYAKKLEEQYAIARAHFDSLRPGPALDDIKEFLGQPRISGVPFPPSSTQGHYGIPQAWQRILRPRDPLVDPPGLPITPPGPADNSSLKAGYNFQADPFFKEVNQYFYHPDHLGSSSYITDLNGMPSQHIAYLPFGETFIEEHSSREKQAYLFNAKELDRETGLYYYGARYYDPQTSIWLGVDPMADKYPNWSPYNYTLHSPVVYIDPNGLTPIHKQKIKGLEEGFGNAQVQKFSIEIANPKKSFSKISQTMTNSPQRILSNSQATFKPVSKKGAFEMKKGSNIDIDVGPLGLMDAPVRVTDFTKSKHKLEFRFATLEDHLEAGFIDFSIEQKKGGNILFSIQGTSKIDKFFPYLLKDHSRKKQIQSWEEVLDNMLDFTGGKEFKRGQYIRTIIPIKGKGHGGNFGGGGASGPW